MSPSYLDLVQAKFGGQTKNVDYSAPQEAIDTINRWVQEQTSDQVRELVTNLDTQTQLLLATVASYQSRCTSPVRGLFHKKVFLNKVLFVSFSAIHSVL